MSLPRGRDAWIPWALAAGFVVFLMGGVALSVIAVRSDPGLVSGAPQRLAGSSILPMAPAPVLELQVSRRGADGIVIEVRVRDAEGRPALAQAVSGTLRRPTHAREDRPVTFELASQGVWRAIVAPAGGGIWEIAVQARSAGGTADGSLRL